MEQKTRCELCGNWFGQLLIMALMINEKPVMLRAYCPSCWPKVAFAIECFIKRTGAQDERAESGPA
jgi:hypothetical protein